MKNIKVQRGGLRQNGRGTRPFLEGEGVIPVQPQVDVDDKSTHGCKHFKSLLHTGSFTTQGACCPRMAHSYWGMGRALNSTQVFKNFRPNYHQFWVLTQRENVNNSCVMRPGESVLPERELTTFASRCTFSPFSTPDCDLDFGHQMTQAATWLTIHLLGSEGYYILWPVPNEGSHSTSAPGQWSFHPRRQGPVFWDFSHPLPPPQ